MKVQVTTAHIKGSTRRNPRNCMIAEALRSVGVTQPRVMYDGGPNESPRYIHVEGYKKGIFFHHEVDHGLKKTVIDWDEGQDVDPFEFEIPD